MANVEWFECFRNPKIINVDFGEVEVGKKLIKTIGIPNESCCEQIYEAQRDPTTNPLDHVFNLRKYGWSLDPGKVYVCEIVYRPFVPFIKNIDYFTITDSTGSCFKIIAQGSSIGPEVSSSTKLVTIYTHENREIRKRIMLTNNSKIKATFMFDIDQKQSPFKLELTHGILEARSSKYITIIFSPLKPGTYAYDLSCLVLHQAPIIIQLYGYYGPESQKPVPVHLDYPTATLTSSFEEYMKDSVEMSKNPPLMSLSRNYIDFGQADVGVENPPQVISLTNHRSSDVLVKWDRNANRIFEITPPEARVRMNRSATFVIRFNPNMKCNLFSEEFLGRIFSGNKFSEFPSIATARVIGHSFPARFNGWVPQYEIPQTVVMPPCVPSIPVYTTFLIKRLGKLPLMFHFVPPNKSHFIVKPMVGVIHRDYQIIMTAMFPESKGENVYVERWGICFNGDSKNEIYIDFKGYAEYANVHFVNEGILNFGPVFPGCQGMQRMIMRNITRHSIMYRFFYVPSMLKVEELNGEISPNDILSQNWLFCPREVGEQDFNIECTLVITDRSSIIGPEVCKTLRVMGRGEPGYLVTIPDELNFGVQVYEDTNNLNFHVFNFSCVNIHYKMACSHSNFPLGYLERDVKIQPISETIFPGKSERITVSITPRTRGYYQFLIKYYVRINSQSHVMVAQQMPRVLCKVNCLCVLPVLKVKDLYFYGPCRNISKVLLWKTLKMNKFNAIVKHLLPGQRQTLNVYLQPMILSEEPLLIKLYLINAEAVPASWILKRVKQCSCQPVVKTRGLSLKYIEYHCIHKEICEMYPSSGNIKPKEEATITIELRYKLLELTEIKWDINVGYDRHIFLNIAIHSLPETEKKLHLSCGPRLTLRNIYFGDKDPVYQTCWVYNNTNNDIPYAVDTEELFLVNKFYDATVFSCVTPYDIVKAWSRKPIILKFQPRQFGIFKAVLPIKLGNDKRKLILQGETSNYPVTKLYEEPVPMNFSRKIKDIPVYFNRDCINLSRLSMHCHAVEMIIVCNNTKNDVLAYKWEKCNVPGVIRVDVHPEKGILQPKTIQSFQVTINTEGCPCKIDVDVTCEFINASQRREYQRSVLKYNILNDELEGQFTITEKDTTIPKPWIKILEEPRRFYKALTIRCYIHSVEDQKLKLTLLDELKSASSNEIYIEKNNNWNINREDDLKIPLFILEEILWDIVNSKTFNESLKEISKTESNLTYSQFKMNLLERKRLEERSYISPPRKLIQSILEKMLFLIVHEEFALETVHLIQQDDIRHINYLRIPFKNNTSNIQEKDTNEKRIEETSKKYMRSASSVSFIE